MYCVLFSMSITRDFLWVTLLLLAAHFDSIVSATPDTSSSSSSSSQNNSMPSHNVIDNDKEIRSDFASTNEVTSTTAPIWPYALNDKMASKPSTARERQKVSDSSLHDNNDYQSMKRAIDTFNEKIDVYMDYQANEMAAHTTKLNSLKDKLNALDVLHHEIDRMVNRQNMAEQSLQVIRDAILGSQSINNKLDRLELLMQQTNVRIDDFMAKQWERSTAAEAAAAAATASNDEIKRKTAIDDDPFSGHGEQCEMKIEQLVAFVHSFAELNRLENTDILNRLGNMQSQLIQFFDIKSIIAINRSNHTVYANGTNESDFRSADDFVMNLFRENDTKTANVTIQNNSMNDIVNGSLETTITTTTPFIVNDDQNIPKSNLHSTRKRKAIMRYFRHKRNHKLNSVTQRVDNNLMELNFLNANDRDIDVNLGIIKSNNQISAKYGQPSQFGCHQFKDIDRVDDEIHRFPTQTGQISERLCAFDKNGSAWTVIQLRRLRNDDTSIAENFNRSWTDYKYGFGNLSAEFWYGNDFMHKLTYDDDMELKIQLVAWDGRQIELQYNTFRIDSEENRYNLFVNGFRGNDRRLDALAYHNNQDFSTFDRQNDKSGINDDERCCSCAKSYASGWWYNNCIEANLNGLYQFNPFNNNYVGIIWDNWLGDYSLKATKMMIRPKVDWSIHNENFENKETNKRPSDDP